MMQLRVRVCKHVHIGTSHITTDGTLNHTCTQIPCKYTCAIADREKLAQLIMPSNKSSKILQCIVQAPTDDESLLGSIVHEYSRQLHKRPRSPLNVRYMRYQWQRQEF